MNINFINRHFYLELCQMENISLFMATELLKTDFFLFLKIKAIKIDIVICFFFFLEK